MIITNKQVLITWLNIAIALLCLPAYLHLGELFKYLIAPYIFYLVLSTKSEYFPALILHFMLGTTVSYFILISCFLISILYYREWFKLGLGKLFLICLLPMPLLLGQVIYRFFSQELDFIESFVPITMYLGFFPFFYGILLFRSLKFHIWKAFSFVMFISLLLNITGWVSSSIRIIFYAIPVLSIISILTWTTNIKKLQSFSFKFISMVVIWYYIYNITDFSLTLILGILAGIFLFFKRHSLMADILSSKWSYILTIIIVVAIIANFKDLNLQISDVGNYGNFEIFNSAYWEDRVFYKLFFDRAPLWFSVWNNLVNANMILPPIIISAYEITLLSGKIEEISYGAHNLFLELLRNYGFIVGVISSYIYIAMLIKVKSILKNPNSEVIYSLIAACVISTGIFGSMFGQYTLYSTFSFLFFSLIGICFMYAQKIQKVIDEDTMVIESNF